MTNTTKKNYVLDTNILLNFSNLMVDLPLEGHSVTIPYTVLAELENQKHSIKRDLKYMARIAVREMKAAVKAGHLTIYTPEKVKKDQMEFLDTYSVMDDLILATVLELNQVKDIEHVLITNDFGMYLKAEALGITVEDYEPETTVDKGFKGFTEVYVPTEIMARLWKYTKDGKDAAVSTKKISVSETSNLFSEFIFLLNRQHDGARPIANSFYELIDSSTGNMMLTSYNLREDVLIRLGEKEDYVLAGGIKPKNKEQMYFTHLLEDSKVPCIQVKAQAGSGKTIISIAWALGKVMDNMGGNIYNVNKYSKYIDKQ
ncbi:MAG: PIN domain-containing protein, partial [Anaeroplasmataceae bacterium]